MPIYKLYNTYKYKVLCTTLTPIIQFFLTKFPKLRNCLNVSYIKCISLKSKFLRDGISKDVHNRTQRSQFRHNLRLHTADVQLLRVFMKFVLTNSHQSNITKYSTYKSQEVRTSYIYNRNRILNKVYYFFNFWYP